MSSKPTHIAYLVINPKDGRSGKASWHEVGAVWPHSKGDGFDVIIHERLSVTGRIVCTKRKEQAPEP